MTSLGIAMPSMQHPHQQGYPSSHSPFQLDQAHSCVIGTLLLAGVQKALAAPHVRYTQAASFSRLLRRLGHEPVIWLLPRRDSSPARSYKHLYKIPHQLNHHQKRAMHIRPNICSAVSRQRLHHISQQESCWGCSLTRMKTWCGRGQERGWNGWVPGFTFQEALQHSMDPTLHYMHVTALTAVRTAVST